MDMETKRELQHDARFDELVDMMKVYTVIYGSGELAKCVIGAIQAYYGPASKVGLYSAVRDFAREMCSIAFQDAFPGDNGYDGTILEGGGGPAQY